MNTRDEAFDVIHVMVGGVRFHVAVRRTKSRRKRRQDIMYAALLKRRAERRAGHPQRAARQMARWAHREWKRLHEPRGVPLL